MANCRSRFAFGHTAAYFHNLSVSTCHTEDYSACVSLNSIYSKKQEVSDQGTHHGAEQLTLSECPMPRRTPKLDNAQSTSKPPEDNAMIALESPDPWQGAQEVSSVITSQGCGLKTSVESLLDTPVYEHKNSSEAIAADLTLGTFMISEERVVGDHEYAEEDCHGTSTRGRLVDKRPIEVSLSQLREINTNWGLIGEKPERLWTKGRDAG